MSAIGQNAAACESTSAAERSSCIFFISRNGYNLHTIIMQFYDNELIHYFLVDVWQCRLKFGSLFAFIWGTLQVINE